MDCLNVQGSKVGEPSLLGGKGLEQEPPPRKERGDRFIKAALGVFALLFLILLALIIWLAVDNHHNKNDIRDLKAALLGTTQSETVSSVAPRAVGSGSSTPTTAVYPTVFMTQNASAQPGYSYGGSLYRGSGYWAAQPPLPSPRADFAVLNVNETLYILGGHDANNNYLAGGFTYNPVLNSTGNVSDMPSARSHFAAGSLNNSIVYVIGGYSSEVNESSNTPEKCSLVYDVTADSWSSGACLNEARGSTCGAVVNGKLFVAGGLGANGAQLSSIELYHPSNNSWSTFARLPSGRSEIGCAARGNNLIVGGGTNGSNHDLNEVWAVDSTSGSMTRLSDMLYPRYDLQLVTLSNGDLVAIGGGQHINDTETGLHFVERYSSRSNQWVEKAPISNQRFAFGAAYINEGVYAIGGHVFCNDTAAEDCGNRVLDSIEVFYDSDHPDVFIHIQQPGASTNGVAPNSSQVLLLTTVSAVNGYTSAGSLYRGSGYWGAGEDIPQPLSDLNVVTYGNEAFIVGGLDIDTVTASSKLYRYDPVVGEYANMTDLPEERTRGGADVLADALYYVGGFTSGSETAEAVDSMLVYNITSNTWSTSNATLSSPRSDLCMAAVNGTLYAAGGYSLDYNTTLNLVEKFNPNTDSWTPVTSMPTPRGDVMCAAMNGLFVVAGGFYDPTNMFTPASFRTEVEAYNPATDTWVSLAPLPVARGDAAMTVIPSQFGDRLVVMGGESQYDNEHSQVATHQVQEYSSALDEWILKAPMITPRFRHDCTFSEGRIIVFGGAASSLFDDEGVPTLRPVASVEQFFDTDNPDVFVYVAN